MGWCSGACFIYTSSAVLCVFLGCVPPLYMNRCANILSFTAALLFLSPYYAMLTMVLCATHIHHNLFRMCGVCLFSFSFVFFIKSLDYTVGWSAVVFVSIAIICERIQHSFVWHLTFYALNCRNVCCRFCSHTIEL